MLTELSFLETFFIVLTVIAAVAGIFTVLAWLADWLNDFEPW